MVSRARSFCFSGTKVPLLISATRSPKLDGIYYSSLTTISGQGYAVPTAQKTAVGFGDSNTFYGASAPTSLGAFFTPEGLLFGVMHGETFGSGGIRRRRLANPVCATTINFGELMEWLLAIQSTDSTIMSNHAFVLNTSAPDQHLIEAAYFSLCHLHALALSISSLAESKYDVVTFHDQLYGLVSLLVDELSQQKELMALLHERQGVGGKV